MMLSIKITNRINEVMFVAEISDIYVSVISAVAKPHLTDAKLVTPGTGNAGKNLEYQATYEGHFIPYPVFKDLMDQVEL